MMARVKTARTAAQVTADRLATSALAQKAAKSTAALQSLTAKGGILGTQPVVQPVAPVVQPVQPSGKKVVSTYTDQATGNVYKVFDDGSPNELISKGTVALNAKVDADKIIAEKLAERQSAYDLLKSQFDQFGLGALVEDLKGLILKDVAPAQFTLELRASEAYQDRFAANKTRVNKGLRAISEAEYIKIEDQYQSVIRNYGLPASYSERGLHGRQEGFEQFIGNDISSTELEDRIIAGKSRVLNADAGTLKALKDFYPDIRDGDILAYVLDPIKGLKDIQRKVTAIEISGAAITAGLETSAERAMSLEKSGVDKQSAQAGFQAIGEILPRAQQLSSVFKQDPFTQATAESEVFGLTGQSAAAKKRRKLTDLEQTEFAKQSGVTRGSLSRSSAGQI